MEFYQGSYSSNDKESIPAKVYPDRDRMSIRIRDVNGNERTVYWYYPHIIRENSWQHGVSTLRYGGFPPQKIEVRSKEFDDRLQLLLSKKKNARTNKGAILFLQLSAVIIALVLLAYFLLVPALVSRLAMKVPVSYEEQLGDGVYNAMQPSFKTDTQRTAYINEFFREMKIQTPYNIRITVVSGDLPNAFAIPGGNIVVYDNLIAGMNSYEELAAVLAHEFSHIQHRHTTRSIFKKLGSSLMLSVIFGDLGAIANSVIGQADRVKDLSYSRKLEKEADLEGLLILADRKIDANGFVRLFQLLQKNAGAGTTNEWINSHPNLDNRIRYLRENENFNRKGIEKDPVLGDLFRRIKS